jgi:hypothetical protein
MFVNGRCSLAYHIHCRINYLVLSRPEPKGKSLYGPQHAPNHTFPGSVSRHAGKTFRDWDPIAHQGLAYLCLPDGQWIPDEVSKSESFNISEVCCLAKPD